LAKIEEKLTKSQQ